MNTGAHHPLLCPPIPEKTIHKAGWIICGPDRILMNGYVLTRNNTIIETGTGSPPATGPDWQVSDHGPGVLLTSLVNAHTHLELSALQGRVPVQSDFQSWVKSVLYHRNLLTTDQLVTAAREALNGMVACGTGVIGDISTLGITRDILKSSGIRGVWFHEFLGAAADGYSMEGTDDDTLRFSVAGHAPHTTDPVLLRRLKKESYRHGLPFSIHVAESEDEIEFLTTGEGPWSRFLTQRGINYSSWEIPCKSPVEYLDTLGVLDAMTIAVHVLHLSDPDIELLLKNNVIPCLCPRSNVRLHDRLPDIERMIKNGLQPALGTDSPASCPSLNLFDEMAFISDHYPGIAPGKILEMATINGARALGFEQSAGTIEKGKVSSFIYLPIQAKTANTLLEQIVSNESK